MVELTYIMIQRVIEYIPMADKKAHVDEYTENIAILFNKETYANVDDKLIDGKTIMETIEMLAKSKPKTYPGLSSKCIFKYMDLIDM
jgi:orotate phosphoribosyltransferase-like protein